MTLRTLGLAAASVAALTTLGACSSMTMSEPMGAPRSETVFAVTASNRLVSFNAGQPGKLLSDRRITGMQPGETLAGIDFRIVKGDLYGLGSTGRLYLIDIDKGMATAVGAPMTVALDGMEMGFDFNPAVDRIRVVSDKGQNLRLHPDTGAVVDADPAREGVQTDGMLALGEGKATKVVAAAYTYNKVDPKMTTNYAIDASGWLVMQGSKEGVQPAVSPNTGRLMPVGELKAGKFERASFDIAAVSDAAFAALTDSGASRSRWVWIDLATGAAKPMGTIGTGEPVRGIAVAP